VNGPIVAEAIKSPEGHLTKFTLANPDDAKVVEEIYLSVLNRLPTPAEVTAGITALRAAEVDHAKMNAAYFRKAAAFHDYRAELDAKQVAWEAGQRELKPTNWTTLDPKEFKAKSGATFAKQADGSLLVSGKTAMPEEYGITVETKLAGITAVRLEVLSDPSLPAKGPGRAPNGNFLLNEFKANSRLVSKPDDKPKPVKFLKAFATHSQEGADVGGAIDANNDTGWAVLPQVGRDHAAMFTVQGPLGNANGTLLTFVMDQRFPDGKHQIGKLRLSVTTDKNPRLTTPVTPEVMAMLDTPPDKRTSDVKVKLRQLYLAQDREYQRMAAELVNVPPTDARVLGAQDLVWALINSPAFLFNH